MVRLNDESSLAKARNPRTNFIFVACLFSKKLVRDSKRVGCKKSRNTRQIEDAERCQESERQYETQRDCFETICVKGRVNQAELTTFED